MKLWPVALVSLGLLAACNEHALKQVPADAGPPVGGLTPEQGARVVAKVGDRTITLADFARTLDRMDQFDRLRYQSKERRRELLEEMIDVELLAAEARRLGIDKEADMQDAVRTILRDAILAQSREGMPAPAAIPDTEIRAYYDSHLDRFTEPERRRVAAIVMTDKKEAQKILKDAQKVKTPTEWGELFFKHSLTAPKSRGPTNPAELAGDIGIVGPLDDPKGANEKVPNEVRAAAFKLKAVGDVAEGVIEADGRQYVVRLNGITPGHKRSVAEADRSIRVLLIQEKMAARERALEDELRQKFTVEIDDKALASVRVPAAAEKSAPSESAADGGK
ncbi:Foldase protein PrsA precursor [Minicystis rosea]|nr:Foldase protein PrsA precursor [Minicystis rosea]